MIEVVSEEQVGSVRPANTNESITNILARVEELNSSDQIDYASEHLAEEEARVEAGLILFYEAGIALAVITSIKLVTTSKSHCLC